LYVSAEIKESIMEAAGVIPGGSEADIFDVAMPSVFP
jgi:hypothetical protein